jgi:hypothetical protein
MIRQMDDPLPGFVAVLERLATILCSAFPRVHTRQRVGYFISLADMCTCLYTKGDMLGKWQVANGKRQTANGKRQTANGK